MLRLKPFAGLLFCLVFAFGFLACQSYQPQALDLKAYQDQWQQRRPDSPTLQDYAKRLFKELDYPQEYKLEDGINLPEAEAIGLFFHPELRALRIQANLPLIAAESMTVWKDPEISLDGLKILESVSKPWILGGALGFTLPLSGRFGTQKALALAEYDQALMEVSSAEWQHIQTLRLLWLDYSYLREEQALIEIFLEDLNNLEEITRKLYEVGEISGAELRLFHLELVELLARKQELAFQLQDLQAKIYGLLGLEPGAELEFVPGFTPGVLPEKQAALEMLAIRNSELSVKRMEYQVAEHALEKEIAEQYPDLELGSLFGSEEGEVRMGLGLNFTLPLWDRNSSGIAQAENKRKAAAAHFYAAYEASIQEFLRFWNKRQALQAQTQYFKDQLIPLVDEQLQEVQTLAELGEFDALLLLDALKRRYQGKRELLKFMRDDKEVVNHLKALIGPGWGPGSLVQEVESTGKSEQS